MKLLITLPCRASELENALHRHCDANGAWQADVWIERFKSGTGTGERLVLAIAEEAKR